ncbi:MAG: PAS domain-containing protein [Solirubrobacteraceae bacterium]
MADAAQQPLDLILARNLMSVLETPSFLVDNDGQMVFFNEAAGDMLGKSFEEIGRLSREEWNAIGPVDAEGRPVPSEKMPLAVALREGRPAHGRFHIHTDAGRVVEVETSAVPLVSSGDFHGAMVVFWPVAR